ncbi:hypothetical protein INT47_009447 [Mucor saturninus]|uniref:Uncharacterized protein n=1 Tax=Mucor saturninus TaxID=64648 RepID=A0A8H7QW59_9FUNG|nr:hypothetical protein INT47_009447 [Mucor saturninus]
MAIDTLYKIIPIPEANDMDFFHFCLVNPFDSLLSYCPFKSLQFHQLILFGLQEEEIGVIQSITLGDILKHMSGPTEKILEKEMNKFLKGTAYMEVKSIFILRPEAAWNNFKLRGLLSLIEKWSETYSEEQNKSHKLIMNSKIFGPHTLSIDGDVKVYKQLVENQLEELYMRRNPVILPNDTLMEQPKSCLKPTIFINIDISSAHIEIIITYLDEGRQVEQTEKFEWAVLCISRRLKHGLNDIIGNYLEMYPYSKRQTTSKKWLKETRDLFAFSKPKLLAQLTKDIQTVELFKLNYEPHSIGSGSIDIYDLNYYLFFMMTYIFSLNKLLEEKLGNKFGNDWQTNNIWYGVSVDKHLLDTVFGSITKLEKLFFAGGMLQKDNELRKAKFCTRGEDIIPAIQHKYQPLNFRLKSYFLVAQISSKHIQLSLHQVVKVGPPGEDPASIIIQDEIFYIEYVYGTLCKSIMKMIQAYDQVDYCNKHKNKENAQYDFQSFETYSNVYHDLKQYVVKLLEKNKANLDMNSKIQLNMNTKCGCSVSISLRDIIEVGLMSAIENLHRIQHDNAKSD